MHYIAWMVCACSQIRGYQLLLRQSDGTARNASVNTRRRQHKKHNLLKKNAGHYTKESKQKCSIETQSLVVLLNCCLWMAKVRCQVFNLALGRKGIGQGDNYWGGGGSQCIMLKNMAYFWTRFTHIISYHACILITDRLQWVDHNSVLLGNGADETQHQMNHRLWWWLRLVQ